MDYRNSTIAVVDVNIGRAVVWQVATTRLDRNASPLSGAWVFDPDDYDMWGKLTFERRCWATPAAAEWFAGKGWKLGLPVDTEAARLAVDDHLQSVIEAFRAHSLDKPLLKQPDWPSFPSTLDPYEQDQAAGSPETGRALHAARWFSSLVGAWDALETERTSRVRQYLHHLGGPNPLPLLIPLAGGTEAVEAVPIVPSDAAEGPGLDFVAIDFETANSHRGSPCAAGLVRFREGEPVEHWYRLMRPPEGADHFDRYNTRIHGITAEQVAGEPRFSAYWPEMEEFIGGDLVVAHNAAFDMSVLRAALRLGGMEAPDLEYACTMRAARNSLDLLSYSLPWVADALDVPFVKHHYALADATACGQVLVELAHRHDADSVGDLLRALRAPTLRARRPLPTAATDANPDHPLFGARVVFTGALDSMPRHEAWALLGAVGGTPQPGVNKQTTIIVIGPEHYQGEVLAGDAMTGKMRKAAALREKGQPIEIMSEDEFLRFL